MERAKPSKSKGVKVQVIGRIRFEPPPCVERDDQEFCVRWGKICHGCCSCKANHMLPKDLDDKTIVHHFKNTDFKLYGLPVPELNKVIGLVVPSVIGKSLTFWPENPPNWQEVINHFKGSNYELYKYFTRIVVDEVKVCIKPESDFFARRNIQGFVGELLDTKDESGMKADICSDLGLNQILERNLNHLSAGEFQRFAIGLVPVQKATVYIFDLPSNYLDIKQRVKAASKESPTSKVAEASKVYAEEQGPFARYTYPSLMGVPLSP